MILHRRSGGTIRMQSSSLRAGHGPPGSDRGGLVGKSLPLDLATRGLCRPRLRSAGTSRISIRIHLTMRWGDVPANVANERALLINDYAASPMLARPEWLARRAIGRSTHFPNPGR